jgi:hypothetical protein
VSVPIGERGAQKPLLLGESLVVGIAAEKFQQLCRALDVREEESDGAARKLAQTVSVARLSSISNEPRPVT